MAGLVCGTIMATITRQRRFYRGASELLYARERVRDAMAVLSTDLRGTSLADTVRLTADSAIEFFTTIGSSVVCQLVANDVGLPTARPSGNSLSAFRTEPDTGDIALFHVGPAGAVSISPAIPTVDIPCVDGAVGGVPLRAGHQHPRGGHFRAW